MAVKTKINRAPVKGHVTQRRARREEGAAIPDFRFEVPVEPAVAERIHHITEWYRLDTRVKKMAYIKQLCKKIVEGFHPEKIILFGSRAYGKPRADSDIDMLVVIPYEGDPAMTAVRILNHLDVLAPIDLLVRSPKDVRKRIEIGDQFMREIVERGKILYETDHA